MNFKFFCASVLYRGFFCLFLFQKTWLQLLHLTVFLILEQVCSFGVTHFWHVSQTVPPCLVSAYYTFPWRVFLKSPWSNTLALQGLRLFHVCQCSSCCTQPWVNAVLLLLKIDWPCNILSIAVGMFSIEIFPLLAVSGLWIRLILWISARIVAFSDTYFGLLPKPTFEYTI